MIKWGRRKPSSASSSRPSSISNSSPFSWVSKFKQMSVNSEPDPAKDLKQKKVKKHSPSVSSTQYACRNGGRFYGCDDDDDAFWRLSFSEDGHDRKINTDVLKSLWDNSDDEHFIPSSSCRGSRWNAKKHGRREGSMKLKEKDTSLSEERKLPKDMKISMKTNEYDREMELEILRRRFDQKAKSVLQEQLLKLQREADEAEFASTMKFELPRTIRTPRTHSISSCVDSKNSNHRAARVDAVLSTSDKKLGSKWQNSKQIEELKSKTEKERKSLHISREPQRRKPKHSPKLKVYSPRTVSKVEICKIKAIEDMRKAKLKMKKPKERIVEETARLDSFAVVKCSYNPQQDFRDSMVEMIKEKHIRQPEEMEELLACFLTLNSEDYHDLIIKVFRQVWNDMNQDSLEC
ncbi:hypothetical protein L6164_017367 [Bauhinia variegata]|uniref:Uncharacterized protein n=1 Tax=Bauhinia variegata TaxID=167791 RepID=A0ACB9NB77_BAUVA|nr:hypothetical protein L6164_017367 [Bauhinia variegata]